MLLAASVGAAGLLEGVSGLLLDGGRAARADAPALLAYAAATWLVPLLPCLLAGMLASVVLADLGRPAAASACGLAAALFVGLALVLDGRGPLPSALGALLAATVAARVFPRVAGEHPLRRALAAWTLLLAAGAACGFGVARGERLDDARGARTGRPLVLLVVADALRRDALSCYGGFTPTPRLDSLAEGGWRVDDALSSSSWTLPAVSTLLSGSSPRRHGVTDHDAILPRALPLLPQVLADRDVLTGAVVGNPILRDERGFLRGFDALRGHTHEVEAGLFWIVRLDRWLCATGRASGPNAGKKLVLPWLDGWRAVARRTGYLAADEATDAALGFVDELDGRDGFLYVHYFDPHDPYLPHPTPLLFDEPEFEPDARDALETLYHGEVAFLDAQVGRLLDGLAARGRFDDALIVFTGDHGEEFLDHGGFQHTGSLYGELVDVPLLVRFPHGVAPGPAPRAASLVDVAPSILAWLGLAPLEGAEGRVLSADAPDVPRFCERVQSDVNLLAVRADGEHAIARFPSALPPARETLETWDGWRPEALASVEGDAASWRVARDASDARVGEDGALVFAGTRPRRDDGPVVARSAAFVVPRDGTFAARVEVEATHAEVARVPGFPMPELDPRLRLFVERRVVGDGRATAEGFRLVPGSVRLVEPWEREAGTTPVVLGAGAECRVVAQVLGFLPSDATWRVGAPLLRLDAPEACVDVARYDLRRDPGMQHPLGRDERAVGDVAARADVAAPPRAAAFERLAGYLGRRGLVETRVLEDDELERLRTIGYVGDADG